MGGCICQGAGEEVELLDMSDDALASRLSMEEQVSRGRGPQDGSDFARYFREWDSICKILASSDVVLVRGSWVERVCQSGGVLPRRQDLPSDAAWSAEKFVKDVRDHRRQTPQVLAISYSWLSSEHPDPDGYHLRTFAPLLRHFARRRKVDIESLAIFIDWCSLPQKPRSDEEAAKYKRALHSVDLWYAHWLTEVWLLTKVPDGVAPFDARGWTSFERAVSSMLTPGESVLDLGRLREGWKNWGQVVQDCQAKRRPPPFPDAFTAELLCKKFSVKGDRDFVAGKYRETFHQVMRSARELCYADAGWRDREVEQLAEVLPICGSLRELELHGNEVTGDGATALAKAIPRCKGLERLGLHANQLSRESVRELVEAWSAAGKSDAGLDTGDQRVAPRPVASRPVTPRGSAAGYESMGSGAPQRTASLESAASMPGTFSAGGADQSHNDADLDGAGSDTTAEQLNSLLARQAAFEARVDTSMARLAGHLQEVAGIMKSPRVSSMGSAAGYAESTQSMPSSGPFPPRRGPGHGPLAMQQHPGGPFHHGGMGQPFSHPSPRVRGSWMEPSHQEPLPPP